MKGVDIAVVGAGPAGISAAVAAAQAGAQVALLDEGARLGGQYFRQAASQLSPDCPAAQLEQHHRGRDLLERLAHLNVSVSAETTVWNLTPGFRLSLHGPIGSHVLQASRVILATGATERQAAFPGWTLPGVLTAGAAQALLKGHGLIPGGRIVVAGSGPLLLTVARQLVDAGADVVGVFEATARSRWLRFAARFRQHRGKALEGLDHWQRLRAAGVALHFGCAVTRVEAQDGRVARATITQVDAEWRPRSGTERLVKADFVAVGFGLVPNTELARLAGCHQRFDPSTGTFVVAMDESLQASVAGLYAAGEACGIGGAEAALVEGRLAGLVAARSLGYRCSEAELAEARQLQAQHRSFAAALSDLFAVQPGLAQWPADDTLICRCEEVNAGQVRQAARYGAHELNGLKAWNRCGMGLCQGRTCGPIAAQLIAAETGARLESTGVFTPRPPLKPVPLGSIARTASPRPTGPEMEDHVGYGMAIIRR
jgi:D-hydroxyproline dehydrogenase subunit alpha